MGHISEQETVIILKTLIKETFGVTGIQNGLAIGVEPKAPKFP